MSNLDFGWLAKFWKQRKGLMLLVFGLTVLSIVARTAYPLMFKFVLDKLSEQAAPSETRRWVMLLIAVGVYQGLMFAVLPNSRAYGNLVFGRLMREKVFDRILRKGYDFFLKFRTGDVITRLTDDLEGSELKLAWYSCSGVMRPIEMSLVILFSLGVMFTLNWKLTLLIFIPLPAFIWMLARSMRALEERAKVRQESIGEINELLETTISGIRIVKGFGAESRFGERLSNSLKDRVSAEVAFIKVNSEVQAVGQLVNNFGVVIALFVGGYFTIQGEMTIGSFFAFANYFQFLVEPIFTIGYFFAITKINFSYVDRLKEIETFPEPEPRVYRKPDSLESIAFEKITVRYPNTSRVILDDVSFKVQAGQTVAVVGPIGCGKTSLLEVTLGELQPEAGSVTWNGIDIRELDPRERHLRIGLVTQEPLLFSETIVNNIRLGNSALSDASIQEAMVTARLKDEVERFPDRANTVLGQRGIELSGGQKQRLSLARALAAKPELLLLDDVTSALDAETEQNFWRNFRLSYPKTTVIVVTHRLATAAQADCVVMLDERKIVANGSHLWLLKNNDRYRSFVEREEDEEAVAA
ncbi:MAG: ABC transporter ATP-binding protein/permease [bacterium]|nr:ABC transporter ATP-binding protein/permease [bacterium]